MIGYDHETIAEAERRVEQVFELGFMPFCQLYQPDETKVYPEQWRRVRKKWCRPAAYMTLAQPIARVFKGTTDLGVDVE